MRIASTDIPIRIDAPGVTARQQTGLGDVAGRRWPRAHAARLGSGSHSPVPEHGLPKTAKPWHPSARTPDADCRLPIRAIAVPPLAACSRSAARIGIPSPSAGTRLAEDGQAVAPECADTGCRLPIADSGDCRAVVGRVLTQRGSVQNPIAHCPLPIAHCPLPIAHCPLPIASRSEYLARSAAASGKSSRIGPIRCAREQEVRTLWRRSRRVRAGGAWRGAARPLWRREVRVGRSVRPILPPARARRARAGRRAAPRAWSRAPRARKATRRPQRPRGHPRGSVQNPLPIAHCPLPIAHCPLPDPLPSTAVGSRPWVVARSHP